MSVGVLIKPQIVPNNIYEYYMGGTSSNGQTYKMKVNIINNSYAVRFPVLIIRQAQAGVGSVELGLANIDYGVFQHLPSWCSWDNTNKILTITAPAANSWAGPVVMYPRYYMSITNA